MSGAVVTGAAGGLGREIARALARRGHDVHLVDLDANRASAEAELIGPNAWSSALDVSDATACEHVAAETVDRAGSLGVWVNNAGILLTGSVWDAGEAARQHIFDVNAHGTMNGTFAALAPMRSVGRGHVINIISLAGLAVPPGEAMYAATKHAALAFSVGTHADLRRAGHSKIHVSALCPDGIWTPMISDRLEDPEAAPSFSGSLLNAADVANRAVELLDRPRVVTAYPRWRGALARLLSAFPNASGRLLPIFLADARRRQRRWRKRIANERLP